MAGYRARNLFVRYAVNRSGRATCGKSQHAFPTAATNATSITASAPSRVLRNFASASSCHLSADSACEWLLHHLALLVGPKFLILRSSFVICYPLITVATGREAHDRIYLLAFEQSWTRAGIWTTGKPAMRKLIGAMECRSQWTVNQGSVVVVPVAPHVVMPVRAESAIQAARAVPVTAIALIGYASATRWVITAEGSEGTTTRTTVCKCAGSERDAFEYEGNRESNDCLADHVGLSL